MKFVFVQSKVIDSFSFKICDLHNNLFS
jgi:hypothetical protein